VGDTAVKVSGLVVPIDPLEGVSIFPDCIVAQKLTLFCSLRRIFSRHGAIRLETEAVERRREISVQAQPAAPESIDEKGQA
jgi:hypothetical protein